MYKPSLSGLVASLALVGSVSAGANFNVCVDWVPAKWPGVNYPLVVIATFGTKRDCIVDGKGSMAVSIEDKRNGLPVRLCSTWSIPVSAKPGCGVPNPFSSTDYGELVVRFDGPGGQNQSPTVSIQITTWVVAHQWNWSQSVGLKGDKSGFAICGRSSRCSTSENTIWRGPGAANFDIIWMPNGSAWKTDANGLQVPNDDIGLEIESDAQAPLEIEL